jgi:hypothetical protein
LNSSVNSRASGEPVSRQRLESGMIWNFLGLVTPKLIVRAAEYLPVRDQDHWEWYILIAFVAHEFVEFPSGNVKMPSKLVLPRRLYFLLLMGIQPSLQVWCCGKTALPRLHSGRQMFLLGLYMVLDFSNCW